MYFATCCNTLGPNKNIQLINGSLYKAIGSYMLAYYKVSWMKLFPQQKQKADWSPTGGCELTRKGLHFKYHVWGGGRVLRNACMPTLKTCNVRGHCRRSLSNPIVRFAALKTAEVKACLVQEVGMAFLSETANVTWLVTHLERPRPLLCPFSVEARHQYLPKRSRGLVLAVTADRRLNVSCPQFMLPLQPALLR